MNLLELLLRQIASLCDLRDESQVVLNGDKLSIGGKELSVTGVFFSEGITLEREDQSTLSDYLDQFLVETATLSVRSKADATVGYSVHKLRSINNNIHHGFFELQNNDGSRRGVVFTGCFTGSVDQPDLTTFPEAVFALCLLEPSSTLEEAISWVTIFEAIGPFAVCQGGELPKCTLAECGMFAFGSKAFSFEWDNQVPMIVRAQKEDLPPEAEAAYLAALEKSNTPDIAFMQLYRVLEILFAVGLKAKVCNSGINDVLRIIKGIKDLSELTMLSTLLEPVAVPFAKFTVADFRKLYGDHSPINQYAPINDWLKKPETSNPSKDLRAKIVYYIRCSLVHSKLGEIEPFLLEPFSHEQVEALLHVVDDMHCLVQSLIY